MTNLIIDLNSVDLTDEQFFQLCANNRDFRFERNANGDLVIISPTGGETGNINAGINAQLWNWNEGTKLGKVFDSSTGFKLPKGGDRSPDASWIPLEKWQNLTPEQRAKFLPLCPDFLIKLLSPTDNLKDTQKKMQEYLDNGAKLAWLINRKNKQVEIAENPLGLLGENILPGFVLEMELIW